MSDIALIIIRVAMFTATLMAVAIYSYIRGYRVAKDFYGDWDKGFSDGFQSGFYACRDEMIKNVIGNYNEVKEKEK